MYSLAALGNNDELIRFWLAYMESSTSWAKNYKQQKFMRSSVQLAASFL